MEGGVTSVSARAARAASIESMEKAMSQQRLGEGWRISQKKGAEKGEGSLLLLGSGGESLPTKPDKMEPDGQSRKRFQQCNRVRIIFHEKY